MEILQELDTGSKNNEICKTYNLSSSTVSTLIKNKGKIMKAYNEKKTE